MRRVHARDYSPGRTRLRRREKREGRRDDETAV